MTDKLAELQGVLWRIQCVANELSFKDVADLTNLNGNLAMILANSSEALKLSDELYVERMNQNGGGVTDETFKS